ncbi:hypothetical protein N3930_45500, partial [Bacillus thuringiensis]|nr:hypothetical protein [Bacillus thuringiensis]
GAVDGVKSQLENLGLVVFSHVEPALVAMTNGTNSAVKSLTDWLDPSGRAVEAAKLMQQTDQQLAQYPVEVSGIQLQIGRGFYWLLLE